MLDWRFQLCGEVVMVRLFPRGHDVWFRCACVYAFPVDQVPMLVAHGGCGQHDHMRTPATLRAAAGRN